MHLGAVVALPVGSAINHRLCGRKRRSLNDTMFGGRHLLGACLACILQLSAAQLTAQNFKPYFNYNGNLRVGGQCQLTSAGTSQTFSCSLTNVDPQCTRVGNAANSCGIHIHQGTSCEINAQGHYYKTPVTQDPWTNVIYRSSTATATGAQSNVPSTLVNTGATELEVTGKTMIVHGYDGGRIACAVLQASGGGTGGPGASLSARNFVKYFK